MTKNNVLMKYFLTFGNYKFEKSLSRIKSEATDLNVFDFVFAHNEEWLKNDTEFWNKHGHFIESNEKGYGYWLWKSYITKKTLELMNEGDLLCYADAGCTINKVGLPRLFEYFDILNKSELGIIAFELVHNYPFRPVQEYNWTKKDIIKSLGASDEDYNSQHIGATSFLLKKCERSVRFVDLWYEYCSDYHLISDSESVIQNHPEFIENRWDQSIFSVLCKVYGVEIISDEINPYPVESNPIWGTRIRE